MLVIRNADVLSVKMDGSLIRAEAVAVQGEKIVYVGTEEGLREYLTEDAEILDAGGNTVLPGMCDAHVHASWSGSALFSCNLFGLAGNGEKKSIVEKCQAALAKYIAENPDKEIIKGCGWDMFDFVAKWPDRHMLDKVCADKPVFLESYCQHHMWLNSKALEMAGITEATPQPHMGIIYKDEKGEPTGLLSEFSAINLVKEGIPGYDHTVGEYKEILRKYQSELANAYGVTLIFDALSTENAKAAYRELAKDGELTIRVRDNFYADPTKPMSQFAEIIKHKDDYNINDLYAVSAVKFFMESGTPDTYMTEPYKALALKVMKRPKGHRGFPYWTLEQMQESFSELMEAGLQIHTHAMGDGAVKHTLDGYEYAAEKTGKDTRNVIAHLMYVQPEDFVRMGKLGVIGCVQPTWMAMKKSDFKTAKMALGRKRVEQFYPYKRFLDAGVVVSAGTDFPVTPPPDPFIEMEHALTRKLCREAQGYEASGGLKLAPKNAPDQDIVALKDVVQSRTISGAYQCFAEDITGSIEAGKSAELVILDRKLEATPYEEIHTCKVNVTVFKGKIVYRR